jgi:hypothetical protein
MKWIQDTSDASLLIRLLLSYLVGLSIAFVVPLAMRGEGYSVEDTAGLFVVFFVGGLFASLPLALLAAILLIAFKSRILARPLVWTIIAVAAAPIAYLLLEYFANFHTRLSFTQYLSSEATRGRIGLALVCAAVSGMLFWASTRIALMRAKQP